MKLDGATQPMFEGVYSLVRLRSVEIALDPGDSRLCSARTGIAPCTTRST